MSHLVVIGRVMGAHGVRGQLRLLPLTDFPERFHDMKELSLYRGNNLVLRSALTHVGELRSRGQVIVGLEGLKDRNQAEALAGCEIRIEPQERMPLEEGQYWISDLIGLTARTETGQELGQVSDVMTTGASDLLEITDSQGKTHLVPLVAQFVPHVSLEDREVTIVMMKGLWD